MTNDKRQNKITTKQCVILCGGLGTRLGELTKGCPKPLLTIAGRPFLDILIENIARFGFNDFILLAGYKGDLIWHHYRGKKNPLSHLDISIRTVIEPEPAGTGGALIHAKDLLESHFLMMNGDSFFDINYLELINDKANNLATIMLRKVDDTTRCGVVELEGERITAFHERPLEPGQGIINSGIYWLSADVLKYVKTLPCSIERDVFPILANEKKITGSLGEGFFIDIGIPKDLEAAQLSIPKQLKRPAVFFDRDGVLNKDDGYTYQTESFQWLEGAKEAIKCCNDAGYYVFVVTNQAGIARGFYQPKDVEKLHDWMNEELFYVGAHIDDFEYCPFHPDGVVPEFSFLSGYRKPGGQMIADLIEYWGVNVDKSLLIGDKKSDLAAARAINISGYLFQSGAINVNDYLNSISIFTKK